MSKIKKEYYKCVGGPWDKHSVPLSPAPTKTSATLIIRIRDLAGCYIYDNNHTIRWEDA